MGRHKWKDTTILTNISKSQECSKCGVSRNWCYSPYNCWEYWWFIRHTNQDGSTGGSVKKTFNRPECFEKIP